MLNEMNFYTQSINDNLYYLRSMREFCESIQASFLENNKYYIEIADSIGKQCERLGKEVIDIANKNVNKDILESEIFVTKYSKEAELLTEKLFNININTDLTEQELRLESTNTINLNNIETSINRINNEALNISRNFITFCTEIKDKINSQELFSYLYLSYYEYMIDEINIFISDLERIINKESLSPIYILGYEYYYSDSFKKSAEFVRNWLDPIYREYYDQLNIYINAYEKLANDYLRADISPRLLDDLKERSIELSKRYKDVISNILKDYLDNKMHLIIPPTAIDNLLTSINFYIYNLTITKN